MVMGPGNDHWFLAILIGPLHLHYVIVNDYLLPSLLNISDILQMIIDPHK